MNSSKETCSLCKDPLQQTGHNRPDSDHFVLRTLCNHLFHHKCLKKWYSNGHDYCQVCNKKTQWDDAKPAHEHNIGDAAMGAIARSETQQKYDGAQAAGAQAQLTSKEGNTGMYKESHTWWHQDGKPDKLKRKVCQLCWQESEHWWGTEEKILICKKCGEAGKHQHKT